MTLDALFGAVLTAILIAGFAVAFVLAVLVVSAVKTLARRRHRVCDGRDGCRCWPCQDFEAHERGALLIAEIVPGFPDDGDPLSLRDERALDGIEAASSEGTAP